MNNELICFCGGGSGGHLSPLYALYQEWQKKSAACLFLVPGNNFDIDYCRKKELPFRSFSGSRFYRGNPLTILIKLFIAFLETCAFLRGNGVKAIVGTGGYGSVPVYLYALWQNIPLFLIEPNKTAGKVNRFFSPFARRIFTHFEKPEGLKKIVLHKLRPFGNPITPALKKESTPKEQLLVFGASLGAASINNFMTGLLEKKLSEISCRITWITGQKQFDKYQHWHNPPQINVLPFHENMPELYEKSFLALCRSGMNTVTELHFFQLPAIFIPYPGHRDRQQYLNCAHLVESGACLLWEDQSLQQENRLQDFINLLADRQKIAEMQKSFPDYPQKNATTNIIREIEGCFKL